MFIEFLKNSLEENSILLIHILNSLVLFILIALFISAKKTNKNWKKVNDYFGLITNTIDSIRYGDLTKKIEAIKKMEIPNSEGLAESLNRMVETLYDRETMVDEYLSELKKNNKFLEAVINTLSDGIIIVNDKFKILRATPQIYKWTKLREKDFIGKSILDFITIDKKNSIETLKNIDITLTGDDHSNFVASTMELKLDDKKKRYIIIVKNVTNERELENLKDDFVATLTHDLKVPIIAETNMLELFLNENFGKINEKQTLALKNMKSSNKELLDLVQTVLETYKLRDGSIKLYKEDILLKKFIQEILEEMTPIAYKNKNNIIFNNTREIRVYADKIQLKRVIKNFIHNAILYGETNSPIEITIGEVPKYIVIKVKDYGKGISKEDIEHIFNKYYSAANKFRKIGTGLGLYLAQQIIKAHNGSVSVDSVEGKYTEFTIQLPAIVNINLHYGE